MTANQINYWNLQESIRSNKAREGETTRHNVAGEEYNRANLLENARHNQAVEREASRHNIQTENAAFVTASELNRHNQATEAVERSKIGVQQQQLAETVRHNREQDSWLGYVNRTNRMNAETNAYMAQHQAYNAYQQAEKSKSETQLNKAREGQIYYDMITGPLQTMTRATLPLIVGQ